MVHIDTTTQTSLQESEIQSQIIRSRSFPLQVGICHIIAEECIDSDQLTCSRIYIHIFTGIQLHQCSIFTNRTVTVLTPRKTQLSIFKPFGIQLLPERFFRKNPSKSHRRESSTRIALSESRISVTTYSSRNQVAIIIRIVQTSHKGITSTINIITVCNRRSTIAYTSISQIVTRLETFILGNCFPTLEFLPVQQSGKVECMFSKCLIPFQHIIPLPEEVFHAITFNESSLVAGIRMIG